MGILTNRDPQGRAANWGPWDTPGGSAGMGGTASTAAAMSNPWLAAALLGGGQVLGALGGDPAAENAKHERKLSREEQMIQMLIRDSGTRQRNKGLEVTAPIQQELMTRILGGKPGGLETANAMPRTYQSSGPPGSASLTPPTQSPGQPDFLGRPTQTTQHGAPADPAQLAALVPSFSEQRQKEFGEVQALTSGIKAENFRSEEIIPQLNDYSLTRGAYTFSDQDPTKATGKEVQELAQSNPTGQVQGNFRNEENDQLDQVEVDQLNDAIRRKAPASEVAAMYERFLSTRLDGGGR